LCLAPLCRAQEYSWIDENGHMHIASDPSEIPAKFRQKAVEDALKASGRVEIVPVEKAKPGDKATVGPRKPTQLTPEQARIKKEYEDLMWEERQQKVNSQQYLPRDKDAEDEAAEEKRAKREEREEETGKKEVPEGFQMECQHNERARGPDCRLVETQDSMSRRHRDAYEKALDDLGVSESQLAKDPDLKKEVGKQTEKNFQRSTPDPYAPANDD
jgi:hypothetical protein